MWAILLTYQLKMTEKKEDLQNWKMDFFQQNIAETRYWHVWKLCVSIPLHFNERIAFPVDKRAAIVAWLK